MGVVLTHWTLQIVCGLRGQTLPWNLGSRTEGFISWFVDVRLDRQGLLYGFAAVAVLNPGSVCRNPCGCRSTPTPISLRRGKQPRDSRGLCEQTRHADHCEGARGGDLDARDSGGIFDRHGGPQAESLATSCDRVTKTGLCRANSRVSLEVRLRDLWKRFRVSSQLGLDFIPEGRQGRTQTGIMNDSFPLRVAVHLVKNLWQTRHQLLPLFPREPFNRRGNLIDFAHAGTLGAEAPGNKSDFAPNAGFARFCQAKRTGRHRPLASDQSQI